MKETKQEQGLRPGFTPLGIWAFSIGTSIGWGSFIVTCNTYLQKSGLLGTVFGLLLGMAVILVITWNLQYMIIQAPGAGGIYSFEKSPVGGYSAILMDVRMPEMDGLDATAAIRRMDREDAGRIPIIALTANAFDEDVQRSMQAGMNAHLAKPVESEHLIRILGELIYEAEQKQE